MTARFLCLLLPLTSLAAGPRNTVDHAGILQNLGADNFANGEQIYSNLCVNCHGADGITPSLPIARAFGKGELKFGTDPYSMFRTLTDGNGLMGPQTWMTPQERYDVIHYIREKFMVPLHPGYQPLNDGYLEELPTVNATPTNEKTVTRNYGPALASQLGRDITSALSIDLGDDTTISYDLHTMDQAALWNGGFLNLEATQHARERGGGVADIGGDPIPGLQAWQWAHDGTFDYPTENLLARGPLPTTWMDYHGHHLNGDSVVLAYSIDGREILESPSKPPGFGAITHTFNIAPGKNALTLSIAALETATSHGFLAPDAKTVTLSQQPSASSIAIARSGATSVAATLRGDTTGLALTAAGRLTLTIPPSTSPRVFELTRYSGTSDAALLSFASFRRSLKPAPVTDPATLRSGGTRLWPGTLTSSGQLGPDDRAYTLDTLTLPPKDNPWNTWFRTSALAFFPDGRMVVSTHGGDIWIVSGIGSSLGNLQWNRFAAGLYEPFGLQVIDGLIYVTAKDRLVRLHDHNSDGEADFYESFYADTDVSSFFHAYNFDLQTDAEGNLYYAKCGQYTSHALPGCVVKLSPDGKTRTTLATGFRTPNGMGITPDGQLTVSDNQGNWMPASKISLIKPGGFYGYVQTHTQKQGLWAPDGGRIDHTSVVPPDSFDPPVIWMPQDYDNSSGGQLWVDDPRWGPLSGRMLHTSFGKGWLYYLMLQEVDGTTQSAITRLDLDATTGIQRARLNPADGQVYAVGLNGWNGNGRRGLSQGGIHRFRYTGKPETLLTDTQTTATGIRLTFNAPLHQPSATDPKNYQLNAWNYRWSHSYGSKNYSVKNPGKTGTDTLTVESAILSPDNKTVQLHIPDLTPAHQLKLTFQITATDSSKLNQLVYLTVHKLPKAK